MIQDFRAQLEAEMEWRTAEVRFFQNLCEDIEGDEAKDKFRRALVLLLYSHFEGYCKFAFALYVSAVNNACIDCREASSAIVAASLHDVLFAMRDGNRKAPEFRNMAPDDTKLHRFARDREFVQRASEIMARKVVVPDSVVDTESNLKPIVLRKNLYRLGLPHDQFEALEPQIDMLLNLRNKIAHGESKTGIDQALYERLRNAVLRIMTDISIGISMAFNEKWFLAVNARE